ncbi:uncharacterized protein HfgLR_04105 [Haloferax gibbonsii]|uniref:Uncharacterized protein n=1 Tax=Haloferax gibbonsii TaxID=35746 RepID=A0A871BDL8_HALGI|nr:hypothetical protein [Haloferax gibbonsii]QOS10965.1 uncharacterized protein HfgLR_04105 [Haloferax gibbonsii]
MTTTTASQPARSVGFAAVFAILLGLFVSGYGLLLVPQSPLGGGWILAIGISLALAGVFAIESVGRRLGLSAATCRTLSLSFAALAAVLFVAFVVVNYASVESFEATSESATGSEASG